MWDVYTLNRKQKKTSVNLMDGVCVNLLNLGFSSKYLVHALIVTYTVYIEKILSGQCNNICLLLSKQNNKKKKKKNRKSRYDFSFYTSQDTVTDSYSWGWAHTSFFSVLSFPQWSYHAVVIQFNLKGAICVDFIMHSHIQSHQHHFSNTISPKCMLLTFSTGKASMWFQPISGDLINHPAYYIFTPS